MQLTLATAALFAGTTLAGKAYVYNMCTFPVYLWSVDTPNGVSERQTIAPLNGSYSEEYKSLASGGVSLKVTPDEVLGQVCSQFEYTYNSGSNIWYDMSNVDCKGSACPFAAYGWALRSKEGCPTRECAAGLPTCSGAYNAYNDDQNTLSCDATADLELYLCTDTFPSSNGTASATASVSATAVASAVPNTVNIPATTVVVTATAVATTYQKREEAAAHRHMHRHPHWRH